MKRLVHACFALWLLIGLHETQAQDRQTQINGKVTTEIDGAAVPGVSVAVKGTTQGTLTDENGAYTIRVANTNPTLVFSSIGYITKEVAVGSRSTVDVALAEDTKTLNEVVVTGLGIERGKLTLGYAAQQVNSEELMQNRQTNLVTALQGKVAGVTINSTGGAPGQGAVILIRGINSIDVNRDNQPLFVIDGILMDNSTSTQGQSSELRGMSNRAADINPNDIETINILKGGAATALYGLRGANGVVVITTKSGKSGALRANFSSTYGIETVNKFPEVQDKFTIGYGGVYNPQDFFPSWVLP